MMDGVWLFGCFLMFLDSSDPLELLMLTSIVGQLPRNAETCLAVGWIRAVLGGVPRQVWPIIPLPPPPAPLLSKFPPVPDFFFRRAPATAKTTPTPPHFTTTTTTTTSPPHHLEVSQNQTHPPPLNTPHCPWVSLIWQRVCLVNFRSFPPSPPPTI